MTTRTPVWKWVSSFLVMGIGAAIAIPLGRYAEQDDAPGGVVVAFLIFVAATALAARIVHARQDSNNRRH